MTRTDRMFIGSLLLTVLVLGGCVTPLEAPPAPRRFDLAVALPSAADADDTAGPGSVRISVPRALPGYRDAAFAYRYDPYELRYYATSRWLAEPAELVHTALVGMLEVAGPFARVLPLGGGGRADYRLDSELVYLVQDFSSTPSRSRLGVRLWLIETGSGAVLGSRLIEAEAAAATEDARGGAEAASRALAQVLGEVDVTLRRWLRQ